MGEFFSFLYENLIRKFRLPNAHNVGNRRGAYLSCHKEGYGADVAFADRFRRNFG